MDEIGDKVVAIHLDEVEAERLDPGQHPVVRGPVQGTGEHVSAPSRRDTIAAWS